MASDQPARDGVPLGEVIGGYRLVRLIGAGSTSHVYLGHHARQGRPAAVKVLHAGLVDNPQVVQRMLTEARVVNDIRHPNIVDVIDVIDQAHPRRVALVMEYIAGPTVDRLWWSGALPWRQAAAIARQLVDAVEAAHQAGVVHRDLKPENLLLTADPRSAPALIARLKVVDFGIAKVAGPSTSHLTGTQTMLGTPAYMAPEQISQSPPPSSATDVFAVGEILYELLSGQRAYRAARLSEVVRQKLRGEIPELPLPPMPARGELRTLIRRCLAFRPDDRPPLAEVSSLLASMSAAPDDDTHEALDVAPASPVGVPPDDTELSEVVGLPDRETALWRPDEGGDIHDVTVGVTGPARVPPGPHHGAADALELDLTEPFTSEGLLDADRSAFASTLGRAYDLDGDPVLQAETAVSAEAPSGDLSARPYADNIETRDGRPAEGTTVRPEGFTAPAPAETEICPHPRSDPSAGGRHAPPAWRSSGAQAGLERALNARPSPARRAPCGRAPALGSAGAGALPIGIPEGPGAEPRGRARFATRSRPRPPVRARLGRDGEGGPFSRVWGATRTERRARRRMTAIIAAGVVVSVAFLFAVRSAEERAARGPTRSAPAAEPWVEVRSQPPKALVEDAETGAFLGETPVPVSVPSGEVRQVRIFKAGFTARVVELTAEAPSTWVPLNPE